MWTEARTREGGEAAPEAGRGREWTLPRVSRAVPLPTPWIWSRHLCAGLWPLEQRENDHGLF